MNITSTFPNFEGIIRISARFTKQKKPVYCPQPILKQ